MNAAANSPLLRQRRGPASRIHPCCLSSAVHRPCREGSPREPPPHLAPPACRGQVLSSSTPCATATAARRQASCSRPSLPPRNSEQAHPPWHSPAAPRWLAAIPLVPESAECMPPSRRPGRLSAARPPHPATSSRGSHRAARAPLLPRPHRPAAPPWAASAAPAASPRPPRRTAECPAAPPPQRRRRWSRCQRVAPRCAAGAALHSAVAQVLFSAQEALDMQALQSPGWFPCCLSAA